MGPRAGEHEGRMGPRAGEHEGRMGPRAGEHEGRMGPRAGEHEGRMGPRAGRSDRSLQVYPRLEYDGIELSGNRARPTHRVDRAFNIVRHHAHVHHRRALARAEPRVPVLAEDGRAQLAARVSGQLRSGDYRKW